MTIYKNPDGTVTMSASKVWRPGVFENEQTARRAQRLDDAAIRELQNAANARGDCVIRASDLPVKEKI